jgi:hypothetical protein
MIKLDEEAKTHARRGELAEAVKVARRANGSGLMEAHAAVMAYVAEQDRDSRARLDAALDTWSDHRAAALRATPDDDLAAECARRGWVVTRG